ncbi:TPA: hypothetical protein NPQ76_004188 [Klebsiella quasipneumoniae subsp. quasipneumoniae]|nr:hypothetical protein [Klebsiella quasipneumoniae subsp. quasipneumoniae]HCI7054626.1 hypothetical protein [Klebsiella quasipneumoniae subsp. quasipneumoniae]
MVVYTAQIRNAIVAEIYEPDAYKGKTCSVRIFLQPDGSVNSATAIYVDDATLLFKIGGNIHLFLGHIRLLGKNRRHNSREL